MADPDPTSETDEVLRALEETRAELVRVVDSVSDLKNNGDSAQISPADALRELAAGQPLEPLTALAHDPTADRESRVQDLKTLADLGEHSVIEPLLAELRSPPDHDRLDCLISIALGNLGDPRAVQPLIDVITSPAIKEPTDVCYYAIEALGKLGDSRAFEPIARTLIYNDRYARCYAAYALGLLGDPRALPYLRWLTDYGSEWIYDLGYIRDSAKESIAQIESNLIPDP